MSKPKVTYVVAHIDGSVMTARDFATREEAEWARQDILGLPAEYLHVSPDQLIVRETAARDRSEFRTPACQVRIDAIAKRMRSGPAFDDDVVTAMGIAFDRACNSFRLIDQDDAIAKMIADKIRAAARTGERDPNKLYDAVWERTYGSVLGSETNADEGKSH